MGDGEKELTFLLPGPDQVGPHHIDRIGQLDELRVLVGQLGHRGVEVTGGNPSGGVDRGHQGSGESAGQGGGDHGGHGQPDGADQ